MTSYLISDKSGPLPFSGAEICAELGIDPAKFADEIATQIAVEVINCSAPTRREVWWVSTGPRFDQESLHGKCHPNDVSAPFDYNGREFVACTYEPRDWAVAIIRKRVIERCRTSENIRLWRAIREADERKRAGAVTEGREQFRASLAEAS